MPSTTEPLAPSTNVAFKTIVETESNRVASIELSPDERWLYAVTLAGEIQRWPIDRLTGALGDVQVLALDYFQDPDGPRGLIGLAFDPTDPSVLWVSDNYPVALWGANDRRPDFSGRVSLVRIAEGDDFEGMAETYIRGLPRSCGDHLTNSLRFRENPDAAAGGPAYLLYLTQGSNSSMGEAESGWCLRPERLLNAAVLEIDPSRKPPPDGFNVATEPLPPDGSYRRFGSGWSIADYIWAADDLKNTDIEIGWGPYASYLRFDAQGVATVRTAGSGESLRFYDPFAEDAVLRIFATGIRNGYDLVWHSNGWLYVPGNGAAGGGSVPDDPSTALDEGVDSLGRTQDLLFRLGRGDYAGHPNTLRDEFVAYGGNPTPEEDPFEIDNYPVGVKPDPRFRVENVYPLGHHFSPNGAMEYTSDAVVPEFRGTLIFANFARGNNLRAMTFDADGNVARDFTLRDPDGGAISITDPLDVTAGRHGSLYVSTLARSNGRSLIIRLDPVRLAPAQLDPVGLEAARQP